MECGACASSYHSLCVAISAEDLGNLSAKAKRDWLCPECRTRRPRSDNSNTPVRPSTPSNMNPDANVTVRRKKPQSLIEPAGDTNVSRSELRTIIQEELRAVMRDFTCELKSDWNRQLKAIRGEISGLTESIQFMNDSFESFKTDLSHCMTKINSIEKDRDMIRSELNSITNRLNQIEQISRSSNLEIQCVPEHKSENLLTIVTQLGKAVSCPISESDVHYCSRTAKKNPESPRPRSILVKLSSPRNRDSLLAAVMKYNKSHPQDRLNTGHVGLKSDKRTPIYVVENLSPDNKFLHGMARNRAKELQYKHVWVRGGRIYMRKTDTSEYVLVRSAATLDSLA
ncbi:uncharacterized protein LOC114352911 [Ostrinia furnacalis]|nr:uncharacterized protein LOC114352911 [Ostrinia furnacalis]